MNTDKTIKRAFFALTFCLALLSPDAFAQLKIKVKKDENSSQDCPLCKESTSVEMTTSCKLCGIEAHISCASELTENLKCPTFACKGKLQPPSKIIRIKIQKISKLFEENNVQGLLELKNRDLLGSVANACESSTEFPIDEQDFRHIIPELRSKGFSVEELKLIQRIVVRTLKGHMQFVNVLVSEATNVEDFITAVSFIVDYPSEDYTRLNRELVLENLDQFFEMNPSDEQIQSVKTLFFRRRLYLFEAKERIFKAFREKILNASSPSEIIEALTLPESTNHQARAEHRKLVLKSLDKFFATSPSVQQIHELLIKAASNDRETDTKIKQKSLDVAKSPEDWISILQYILNDPDGNYEKENRVLVLKNLDKFFETSPTPLQVHQFLVKGPIRDIKNIIKVKKRGLAIVKSPEDWITILQYTVEHPNAGYEEANRELVLKNLGSFFTMNPSAEQIQSVKDLFFSNTPYLFEMRKKIFKAASSSEIIEAIVLPENISDETRAEQHKLIRENLNNFFATNPTAQHVHELLTQVASNNPRTIIEIKKRGLAIAKSPEDWITILRHTVDIPNADYEKANRELVLESSDQFLAMNPSGEQIQSAKTLFFNNRSYLFEVKEKIFKASNAEEIIRALELPKNADQERRAEHRKIALENLDKFFSMTPSAQQTHDLIAKTMAEDIESIVKAKQKGLKIVKSPQDFITLVKPVSQSDDRSSTHDFVIENFDHFLNTAPGTNDFNLLVDELRPSRKEFKEIVALFLPAINSKEQLADLKTPRFMGWSLSHMWRTSQTKKKTRDCFVEKIAQIPDAP